MKPLARITLEGFVFSGTGVEYEIRHDAETFPSNAEFVNYDEETLTVTYQIVDENENASEASLQFTQSEVDAAEAMI